MAEKALVDDADSGRAFIIRPINILYSVISSCAVYLRAILRLLINAG
jgi:hypothetical protein